MNTPAEEINDYLVDELVTVESISQCGKACEVLYVWLMANYTYKQLLTEDMQIEDTQDAIDASETDE